MTGEGPEKTSIRIDRTEFNQHMVGVKPPLSEDELSLLVKAGLAHSYRATYSVVDMESRLIDVRPFNHFGPDRAQKMGERLRTMAGEIAVLLGQTRGEVDLVPHPVPFEQW